jgi:hypothetical protein
MGVTYIIKQRKKKTMNAVDREKEVRMEGYRLHFQEKYSRAKNIKKIRTINKLKEMMTIKKIKQ